MKKYIGLISEVSDVIYQNQVDADSYVKIAKEYKGRILELGSGSGHISLELAREGYDVTCIEIQRDMIQLHKKKLDDETRSNTEIILGDMCSFELEKKFDLIIAPDNVISYLSSPLDFLEMLLSVKNHLSNKGVFIIEATKPNEEKMKSIHGVENIHYYTIPRNGHKVEERTIPTYNFETQKAYISKVISEFENKKIKRRVEYKSEEKFWFENQIENMVKEVGLSAILKSGQLGNIEPINDRSEHMVFYIKKV